jgi:hypothetical protein
LNNAKGSDRTNTLIKLGQEYANSDPVKALVYLDEAYKLSIISLRSGKSSVSNYAKEKLILLFPKN